MCIGDMRYMGSDPKLYQRCNSCDSCGCPNQSSIYPTRDDQAVEAYDSITDFLKHYSVPKRD